MIAAIVWGLVLIGIGAIAAPILQKNSLNWRWLIRRRAFGGSRWARRRDVRRFDMTKIGGLFLGQLHGLCGLRRADLFHGTEGHLITIAGSGGGKSTGLVVPTLCGLTQGSVIVTDPSGELSAMTARRRAQIGPVVFLIPFKGIFDKDTGLNFPDDGFNPFRALDPKALTFASDVNALARLLMVGDRRESGSYWNDEGAELLSLMIAAIILLDAPDLHNLAFLHGVVRERAENIRWRLERIADLDHPAFQRRRGTLRGHHRKRQTAMVGDRVKKRL